MKRRELLKNAAMFGFASAMPLSVAKLNSIVEAAPERNTPPPTANPLQPPKEGSIPVAFVISDGAVMIDFVYIDSQSIVCSIAADQVFNFS